MENLTEKQVLKMQELLHELNQANVSVGSDCKIEDLKLFTDNESNMFLSYICRTNGAVRSVDKMFVKIDVEGAKSILNREKEEKERELLKLLKT